MDDFAAFILTHGRPDRVITYDSLKRSGYTGRIVIVIDNEDDSAEEYRQRFGDKVVVFDKRAIAGTFDEADNFDDRRAIVYARNACFGIAQSLGVKHFIELDDDYWGFLYKFDSNLMFQERHIANLDAVLASMLRFFRGTSARSVAFAQNGDFIGGKDSGTARSKGLKRKCMNTFICSTDRPFQFIGRINEDVNTYTRQASVGQLFLTVPIVAIGQQPTQSSAGGMTDIYLDGGTYVKSFYSVIFQPSSVKVRMMGERKKRLHHHVSWRHTVPAILAEQHKKRATMKGDVEIPTS